MPSAMTSGWRMAATEQNDTLQRLALRELGDAGRWPEIAWLNDLLPPYITTVASHPLLASGRVVLAGGSLKIPSPAAVAQGVTPAEAFGIDLQLQNGDLTVAGGDIVLISGVPNLRQALMNRLTVAKGDLPFHPKYGNSAGLLRGSKGGDSVMLLALRFCEETVLADPRVVSVRDGTAAVVGDAVRVELTAVVDDGTPLRLQVDI